MKKDKLQKLEWKRDQIVNKLCKMVLIDKEVEELCEEMGYRYESSNFHIESEILNLIIDRLQNAAPHKGYNVNIDVIRTVGLVDTEDQRSSSSADLEEIERKEEEE